MPSQAPCLRRVLEEYSAFAAPDSLAPGGLWANRKLRELWDARNNRRSFTVFRMTAHWREGWVPYSVARVDGGQAGNPSVVHELESAGAEPTNVDHGCHPARIGSEAN